jgi:hypothetical protein
MPRLHTATTAFAFALALLAGCSLGSETSVEHGGDARQPAASSKDKGKDSSSPASAENGQPSAGAPQSAAPAGTGLVVHATELSMGRGTRADDKLHPYGDQHAFAPYILPAGTPGDQPTTVKHADGSVTVFFSTLEEMMHGVAEASRTAGQKVQLLSLHTHGVPGGTSVPRDREAFESTGCQSFKKNYTTSDEELLDTAYDMSVTVLLAMGALHLSSHTSTMQMPCSSYLEDWQSIAAKVPEFGAAFAPEAQLHIMACVSGMGESGESFTRGLADLLFRQSGGSVMTSIKFGIGDWSTPRGMAFWDYDSFEQYYHDANLVHDNHQVSSIAQTGTIRVARYSGGQLSTMLLEDRDIMPPSYEPLPPAAVEQW